MQQIGKALEPQTLRHVVDPALLVEDDAALARLRIALLTDAPGIDDDLDELIRSLLRLAGVDRRTTAGRERTVDLLQGAPVPHVPGRVAKAILEQHDAPVGLALTRQNLPVFDWAPRTTTATVCWLWGNRSSVARQ